MSQKKNKVKNKINSGQKLWNFAKKIIPSGNMLLSKNPDRFLPNKWPTYYKNAKGCTIWDLDNKKYTDFSVMGVGTNILGYANSKVDRKVIASIKKANMTTFNCPEEIYLAERLIELHPWFQMVRFARTGGEANSIAIRIGRASSGRDGVAVCGYHGWHDWYLSSNLQDKKNLDTHLIKSLQTDGVPKALKNTVFPFEYNDLEALKKIIKTQKIGVIKMEVYRNVEPKNNFLKEVRNLASKNNIVLIFDECTSGFRKTFGGLHKFYNVMPDMAIFGKALGNGYAITAILGKEEIMRSAQNTFISSTFWTEKIGSVAGLSTLKTMNELKSWKVIDTIGSKIKKTWLEISKLTGVPIKISGLNALAQFEIVLKKSNAYRTLITQEMLKKNILATDTIYVCIDHKGNLLQKYYDNLEKIFRLINKCEEEGNIKDYLKNPEVIRGLPRLN
ncbi:aminotransferase class III-fold pyridoxal phosphate-dependent enzyme [Candidatus Pelagibacter bacterium]|nr:aminotransferase class III-fold pyridoxal phosphate-dependent enzyme [Candidatus Pelagibacter bacterium]